MDITSWRKKVEELDGRLVELLNERSRCAIEIGKLKRGADVPVHQPEREQEILDRVQRLNRGPLSNPAIERLFQRILEEARVVQRQAWDEKKD